MDLPLSRRVKGVAASPTLAITAKAKQMKQEGMDVIGLGAGEPDFNTPQNIIDAAVDSMNKGFTKYTPSSGIIELKQAIVDKLAKDQSLNYETNQVFVGTGAKHVLYSAFQTILNPGDEVIIPVPYWVTYPEQVKLAGGVPVFVETGFDVDFKISAIDFEKAITKKTKAIVLNSPNNPSGMCYTKAELAAIGAVAEKHQIYILSDEIYEKLYYGNKQDLVSIASLSDRLYDLTILINGVSKAYSMTGWRIGYAAANKELIAGMSKLADHLTSNPTVNAQYAALEAYVGSQEIPEKMYQAFEERMERFYPELQSIPGFKPKKPDGAFYFFIDAKEAAHKKGFQDVDAFVAALLEEAKVAVIPGSGFGMPDYIRLSYATNPDLFQEAINRIKSFMK
ncbi:pyridoxal phosphate-dependent aminotransferase [Listeria ivanovii]|uniref:Aminotransferase n=2 Tax=Listeria ivanovii TaxID=1638 RepID=A0ABS1G3E3_LISIV|nr:pyridoxal phosphate-dependent aminotransferase [Listeria ivanovii]EFR96440.1 aspartate transaminase [Listeria ivanovii FSL F6-596]AIS60303.1 aspartate aminotransferase [Listeria ivanovii subsp. londoniensis]AIS63128.1 aspartate aminotransferase [Listeria ivanovii subsp. londoniensis]MBK1961397.1 pyridoxal phosphate-dependent aminotransferase [Listeria ivanovii subsp. londoniensis]MBK1966702.1 pyridoxal phosphate-dependent aminotransferase [Listeria ivanovii subsp. londoniensis]